MHLVLTVVHLWLCVMHLSTQCLQKTPLHYAAMHGHLSVVEHLVEHLVEQGAPAISKKEHVDIKDENEVCKF